MNDNLKTIRMGEVKFSAIFKKSLFPLKPAVQIAVLNKIKHKTLCQFRVHFPRNVMVRTHYSDCQRAA